MSNGETMKNILKREGIEGLKLLDFPVQSQPVFDKKGMRLNGFNAIIRPDTSAVLGMVRSRYELLTHRESVDPFVDKLTSEGWDVGRVQMERNGSTVCVELTNKEGMKPVQKGDLVGRRLTIRNSYDGMSSVSAELGAIRLVCKNGLVAPDGKVTRMRFNHISNVFEKLEEAGHEYARIFDAMLDSYRGLAETIVSPEIAERLLKEVVGQRKLELVTGYWMAGTGSDGRPTAWNLYNAVTEYLTHAFEGTVDTRDFKSRQMLNLLINQK
jgi:hypothetical protein